MKAIELQARWDPTPDFELGPKDIEGNIVGELGAARMRPKYA